MTVRFYSNMAPPTTLAGPITNVATTMVVASTAGLPPFDPFTMAIEKDTPNMELVEVTARAGTTFTITRGIDGTTALSHNTGTSVEHVSSARDFADSRTHENSLSNVHGVTGALVGTGGAQTLSAKTLVTPIAVGSGANSHPLLVKDSSNADILDVREFGANPQGAYVTGTLDVRPDVTNNGTNFRDLGGTTRATIATNGRANFATQGVATAGSDFLAAAGWSTSDASEVYKAGILFFTLSVLRTGANIVANAAGNITDTTLGTVNGALVADAIPAAPTWAGSFTTNVADGSFTFAPSTGSIVLRTLSPTATIATGELVNITLVLPAPGPNET